MSIKLELQIKEHNIIVKSNTLIEASSRLNLIEQKILLCLASNIEPTDKDFKTYTFPIKKFHGILKLVGSTKYTELSEITKQLLSKIIEIRNGDELIQVSWLSSAIYNKKKGTIDMRFDPLLKPFLLELNNKFTSYRLSNILKLKSTYSIRIYELLKQYESVKERTIYLNNLRYYLDAVNIYPNYANFKQRILKPTQKELSLNTDIFFEFEEIKHGKKVEKIRFVIHSKKENIEPSKKSTTQIDNFQNEIAELELSCNEKIHPKILKKWKEHEPIVSKIIKDTRFRTNIKSPIAYIEYLLNIHLNNINNTIQESNFIKIPLIVTKVIDHYAKSTGTIATFLVKKTFMQYISAELSTNDAEKVWKENEEYIMKKIYQYLKINNTIKKKY